MAAFRAGIRPARTGAVDPVAPPVARHPVREVRMQRVRVARVQPRVGHRHDLPRPRQPQLRIRPHVGHIHHVHPHRHVVPQPRRGVRLHPLHLAPARHRLHLRRRQVRPDDLPGRRRHRRPRQRLDLLHHHLVVIGRKQQHAIGRGRIGLLRRLHPRQLRPHLRRPLVFRHELAHPRHVVQRPDRRHPLRRRLDQIRVLRHVPLHPRPRRLQRRPPLLSHHVVELHQPRCRAPRAQRLHRLRRRCRPQRPRRRLALRARRVHHPPVQQQRRRRPRLHRSRQPRRQTPSRQPVHAAPSPLLCLAAWFSTPWKTFFHAVENPGPGRLNLSQPTSIFSTLWKLFSTVWKIPPRRRPRPREPAARRESRRTRRPWRRW